MADNVDVRLGAQTVDLTSQMAATSASVADSLAKISDTLAKFGSDNKRVTEQAIRNNADLSRSFLELRGSLTSGFNAIAGVVERFRGVMGTLAGALAGGLLGREAVKSMLDTEEAVRGLEIVMGLGAEKATDLAIQLKLAGVGVRDFELMSTRLATVMRHQPELFNQFNIATKDSSGALLPLSQIMANVYDRMQDFKAGADQDMFALTFVRRGAVDFGSDMERMSRVQERTNQLIHDFGIEMGPETQTRIENYRVELNAFSTVMEHIGTEIGIQLLDTLTRLASWFSENKTGIDAVTAGFKLFASVLLIVATVAQDLGKIVASMMESMRTRVELGQRAMAELWRGHMLEVFRIVMAGNDAIKNQNAALFNDLLANTRDALSKLEKLWDQAKIGAGGGAGGPAPVPRSGPKAFPDLTAGGKESAIPGLEAELKAEQSAFNNRMLAQGSFQVWSEAQTRDYWELVMGMQGLSQKDMQEATNKFYDAERRVQEAAFAGHIASLQKDAAAFKFNYDERIRLAQQAAAEIAQRYGDESKQAEEAARVVVELEQRKQEQLDRLADLDKKRTEAVANFEYNQAKTNLDQQVALRRISTDQALGIEQGFLDQRLAMDKAAVEAEITAMGPNDDPVKMQTLKNQLLTIELDYQTKKTALVNAAEKEREQFAITAANDVQNAFGSLLANLADGTKKWSQVFQDALKQITSQLNALAGQAIAKQLFGAGTTGGNFLNDIFGKIFGAGAGAGGAASLTAAGTTLTTAGTELIAAATALQASATAASLGGLGGGGGLNALVTSLFPVPQLAAGTPFVARSGLAIIHRGEAVIPASMNRAYGMTVHNQFILSGGMDTRTQTQIALAASRSVDIATRRAR